MTARTLLLALCLLLCSEMSAVSKSSAVNKDDPWNPHHIDDLPVEIRQYIAGICKAPPALSMTLQPTLRTKRAGE